MSEIKRINTRAELEQKREHFIQCLATQDKQILICGGTGCVAGGSLKIYDRLKELMEERDIACTVQLEEEPHDHSIGLKKSGCHGFCEMGPLLRIEPMGWLYIKVKVEDCEDIIEQSILGDQVVDRLVYRDKDGTPYQRQDDIPFYKQQTRGGLRALRPHQRRIHPGIHRHGRLQRCGKGPVRHDAGRDRKGDLRGRSPGTRRRRLPHRKKMGAGAASARSR